MYGVSEMLAYASLLLSWLISTYRDYMHEKLILQIFAKLEIICNLLHELISNNARQG